MYFLCYICNGEVVRRNVNTLCYYSLYYKEGQKSNSPCYEDLVFNVGVSEVITACILKQYIGTKGKEKFGIIGVVQSFGPRLCSRGSAYAFVVSCTFSTLILGLFFATTLPAFKFHSCLGYGALEADTSPQADSTPYLNKMY